MSRPGDDKKTRAMYDLYQTGYSLAQVGRSFGITRQSVYAAFARRGLGLRQKTFLPTVEFMGLLYTDDHHGYLRGTTGTRDFLHHAVWISCNGPMPPGYDVHHKDGNKTNNAIENLELVTPREHGLIHKPEQPVPVKYCAHCGKPLVRRRSGKQAEGPTALAKRQFCNHACHSFSLVGKPR